MPKNNLKIGNTRERSELKANGMVWYDFVKITPHATCDLIIKN